MSFMTQEEETEVQQEVATSKVLTKFPDVITMIIYGQKGHAKSTTAYAFNKGEAKFAVLDFDGNAENVLRVTVPEEKHSNYKVYNIGKLVDTVKAKNDKSTLAIDGNKIFKYVMELLTGEIKEMKPNVIIVDGFQELEWLCRMAMKASHNTTAFANSNINHWNTRNWNIDVFYALAKVATTDLLIYTMHEIEKAFMDIEGKYDDKKEEKPDARPQPQWKSDVKEKSQIVARPEKAKVLGGTIRYDMYIENNKITGNEGRVDITRNPKAFWDKIFEDTTEPFI